MTVKKRRAIPIVLLALVFLISVGMMVRQQLLYRQIVSDSEEAAQIARLPEERSNTPPSQPGPDVPTEEPSLPEEAAALAGVDLGALRAVNEDVAGWIEIPGTELSYPLVQGADNQYYLSRNWKREASGGGSVFLESTDSRDLTAFHTIAYGHRMRNGTMFGALRYYRNLEFWQEHPCVYIVTEAGVHRYEIFATQEAGVKEVVYRLDMEESGLEEEFLRYCIEGSVIDTGITPGAGDRILTLSTCTGNGYARRWVVHAVLRDIWASEAQFEEPLNQSPYADFISAPLTPHRFGAQNGLAFLFCLIYTRLTKNS